MMRSIANVMILGGALAVASCGSADITVQPAAPRSPGIENVVVPPSTAAALPRPEGKPTANRSSKATPLGSACWSLGEVLLDYTRGVTITIGDDLSIVKPSPDVALDALLRTLAQRADEIRAELATMGSAAVNFMKYAAKQLDASLKALQAADPKLTPTQRLGLLDRYLVAEDFDGAKEFVAAKKLDPACAL